jgi:polyisoprenoid-binding protein YceI
VTDTAIRSVDGVELPAPGPWQIDPCHTEVSFVGRHLGLSRVRGRFTGVEGTINVAEDITRSRIAISIDTATVDSGANDRDDSLRSENWFDAARYPTAAFRSTNISADGSKGTITGELTIKGITRTVELETEYLGHTRDPWGNDRVGFSATTTIKRQDWALTVPQALGVADMLVSKDIRLEIETELIKG